MSGLIRKDFYLIMANKKMYVIFGVLAIVFASIGKGDSAIMAVAYFTMILGMSVLSTITYDEYDHSIVHLMTLPIHRKDYAIGKSIFSFLSLLFSWVVGMVLITLTLLIKGDYIEWNSWILSNIVILLIMTLLIGIMLPIQIRFGGENGKIVLIGFVLVIFICGFGLSRLIPLLKIDVGGLIEKTDKLIKSLNVVPLCIGSLMIMAFVFCVSGMVSILIVNKKEY